MTALIAGLALGVASSLHCAAMCGPLVMAVRHHVFGRAETRVRAVWLIAPMGVYHVSRVAVYALLGLIAGHIGRTVTGGELAAWLSLAAGAALVVAAVALTAAPASDPIARRLLPWLGRGLHWAMARAKGTPRSAAAVAGALNALLPCGMVYAALSGALATGDGRGGATFMGAFGAGTLAGLMPVTILSPMLLSRLGRRRRFLQPVAIGIVGLLLMGRALVPILRTDLKASHAFMHGPAQ